MIIAFRIIINLNHFEPFSAQVNCTYIMATITYNGQELVNETEMFHDVMNLEFGFTAIIKYKDEWFPERFAPSTKTVYNLTEVHHLYRKDAIALESDIHYTGGTYELDEIEYIKIVPSKKLYKSFERWRTI